VANLLGEVTGPKYNGKFLHDKIKNLTNNVNIADTVTNIIVPTFDIKALQPVLFNTYEAKNEPLKNAHLSDICISTSAAPTYFPAHYFKTYDPLGKIPEREYNLVDGGVAANNPTMAAMSMITKEVIRRNPDFNLGNPADCRNYLIISIGTGSAKQAEMYTAPDTAPSGASSSGSTMGASPRSSTYSPTQVLTWLTSTPRCSSRLSELRRITFASRTTHFMGTSPPWTSPPKRTWRR
jgi:predicted acylesterase/phospholipase RssA